jgi:hypothetical protein
MKAFRLCSLLALFAMVLFNCKKEQNSTLSPDTAAREETSTLPDGITVSATSNTGNTTLISELSTYACVDFSNYFQMGIASNSGNSPYIFNYSQQQLQQGLVNGGWSSVQAQKAINALYSNPSGGTPLLAFNAAGILINTLPVTPDMRTSCYFGNSLAFNANYTYSGFCGTAFIDNYFLGYSKPTGEDNCLFGLPSANSFTVENAAGTTQTVSFGNFNNTVNAMIASGYTITDVNNILINMANGTMPATEFWNLMSRIVQYYPGMPSGNGWRLKQVYFSLLFTSPTASCVRYVICGDTAINCSVW